ncbi:MAG: hypothetical protein AAF658_00025 [Myxococcota bacterium]
MRGSAPLAAAMLFASCGDSAVDPAGCGSCRVELNGSCVDVASVAEFRTCSGAECSTYAEQFPECVSGSIEPGGGDAPCTAPGGCDPLDAAGNRAPVATGPAVTVAAATEARVDLAELFSDPDGDPLEFTAVVHETRTNFSTNFNLDADANNIVNFIRDPVDPGDFDQGVQGLPFDDPTYLDEVAKGTLSIVDASAELAAAGFSDVAVDGRVFRFENTSTFPAWVVIEGIIDGPGGYTISAVTRVVSQNGNSDPCLEFGGGLAGSLCYDNSEFQRISFYRADVTDPNTRWAVVVPNGTTVEFIANELINGDGILDEVIETQDGQGHAPGAPATGSTRAELRGSELTVEVDPARPVFVNVSATDGAASTSVWVRVNPML